MRRHNDYDTGRKVYIGPYLDPGVTSDELRDLFSKYGPIQTVWAARNPPGFAFVTFEDAKDAETACHGLDGTEFCGKRIRVEIAHGPRGNRNQGDRNGGTRYGRYRSHSMSPARRRRSPSYGDSPHRRSSGRKGRKESTSPHSHRNKRYQRSASRSREDTKRYSNEPRNNKTRGRRYEERSTSSTRR